jgi:hypothetical protein
MKRVPSSNNFFKKIPSGFTKDNSIFDVPCGPGLALGRTTFTTLIFLDGPVLDGGGATLDEVAQTGLVFAFFVASFFDTSAFRFSLTAWEALLSGRGHGA